MATVAEFALEASALPLGAVFEQRPEARIVLEPAVQDASPLVTYFWVLGSESDDGTDVLAKQSALRDVRHVDTVDGDHLLRCRWVTGGDSVLDALAATAVVVLSAVGTDDGWTLKVRGETQEAVSAFRRYCQDHGTPVSLEALHGVRPLDARCALTDKQREAVTLAYERGYFDSPRTATLAEVADELGISQQAMASRLRRGTRRLVERVFVDPPVETGRSDRV